MWIEWISLALMGLASDWVSRARVTHQTEVFFLHSPDVCRNIGANHLDGRITVIILTIDIWTTEVK